jgi:hypothetical protein
MSFLALHLGSTAVEWGDVGRSDSGWAAAGSAAHNPESSKLNGGKYGKFKTE